MSALTYIDLFAGCGGLSVGFDQAGLRPKLLLEKDAWGCASLRANFPDADIWQRDIRTVSAPEIEHLQGVDIIAGGPPCQGFSVAGAGQFGVYDPRNDLVLLFLEWVRLLQPAVAVIENVPTLVNKRDEAGKRFTDLINEFLERLDYHVDALVLDAADFGAPQHRRRVFFIARRKGVPAPTIRRTHSDSKSNLPLYGDELKPFTQTWEALSDLPQIGSGQGSDDAQEWELPPQNDYQAEMRIGSTKVHNHVAMKHTARLIERFKQIGPGESLKDVDKEHGQLRNRVGGVSSKPFKYNNYRLDPEKLSLAIPASFQSLFLHPFLHRNLTAREAARLFGFPDRFVFKGKRTTMSWEKYLSQYNQIGNAVSPLVTRALGMAIRQSLSSASTKKLKRIKIQETRLRASLDQISVNSNYSFDPSLNEILDSSARALLTTSQESTVMKNGTALHELALFLFFLNLDECPLCRKTAAPFSNHNGQIVFAISKDDVHSLIAREKDHGMDFHLRVTLGTDHLDVERIHNTLTALGWVEDVQLRNPRTGRQVRGARALKVLKISPTARDHLLRGLSGAVKHTGNGK